MQDYDAGLYNGENRIIDDMKFLDGTTAASHIISGRLRSTAVNARGSEGTSGNDVGPRQFTMQSKRAGQLYIVTVRRRKEAIRTRDVCLLLA